MSSKFDQAVRQAYADVNYVRGLLDRVCADIKVEHDARACTCRCQICGCFRGSTTLREQLPLGDAVCCSMCRCSNASPDEGEGWTELQLAEGVMLLVLQGG